MKTEIIVNNLIDAIENRDAHAVGNLLSDNVIFENIPENSILHGREAAQAKFADFFRKTSSIKWNVERKMMEGNTAIIERKNHICFEGKNIILPMVTILEIENDKVKLFREYFDAQTFMNQI